MAYFGQGPPPILTPSVPPCYRYSRLQNRFPPSHLKKSSQVFHGSLQSLAKSLSQSPKKILSTDHVSRAFSYCTVFCPSYLASL